jgi:hypothetical protein
MRLPFPYVRWDSVDSFDGADIAAHGLSDRIVNGDSAHRTDFANRYARWMERIGRALSEEGARIAANGTRDLSGFDRMAEEMASAIADYRRECAALIQMRSANGSSRLG